MKKKKYVNIESETDSFGIETPKKINWQDGTVYLIERVIHIIRKKSDLIPSHIVLGENYGLVKLSMVMLEQIKVVNKSELGDYIGHIDNEYIWKLINNGIKKTFGLWIYQVVFQNLCKVQKWYKNLSGNRVCEPQVGLHALSAS